MKTPRIMKYAPYFMAASLLVMLVAGVAGALTGGLRLGIDFTGGTILNMDIGQTFENAAIERIVKKYVNADFQVASSGGTKAIIRMQDRDVDAERLDQIRADIVADITGLYPDAAIESIDRVGATAGRELVRNAFLSVVIACGCMLVYIWIRFQLLSGLSAIIALVHDVAIMVAAMILFRVQVNSSFIAAILTIVGYSINDTIVVFDRIREYQKKNLREQPFEEIVDRSVWETLPRTLNTALTTLFTITLVYILGVASIREFALPLIVGIVSGTYSSDLIASPMWVFFRNIQKKRRLAHKTALRKA